MGGQGTQGVSSEGLPAAFQCGRRHHMGQSEKMAEIALKTSPFWLQRQESTHASPPRALSPPHRYPAEGVSVSLDFTGHTPSITGIQKSISKFGKEFGKRMVKK